MTIKSKKIEIFKELQKTANKKGGKCLSYEYQNTTTKLLWECKESHQWRSTAYSIKKGSWCPICKKQDKLKEVQRLAKIRDGKCLSDTYVNSNIKMLFECKEKHQWETSFRNIKYGNSWCPHCSKKAKLTIEEMQKIASERGGKCLSQEYINQETKLLWKCAVGHKWQAKPKHIKNDNQWCPICFSKRRDKGLRKAANTQYKKLGR